LLDFVGRVDVDTEVDAGAKVEEVEADAVV